MAQHVLNLQLGLPKEIRVLIFEFALAEEVVIKVLEGATLETEEVGESATRAS